ncbi:MAG: IclR family transcriptional regulator [Fibrobacteres bacterium]|nr:IclR family transcriptional regulator [Fibrobacterota bacterium]
MEKLLAEIAACNACSAHLPHGPRPVVTAGGNCRILIIGQAPGRRVHESGIPWMDQSGKELRRWLGVTEERFYDPEAFGLIPMGFCYPGKGKSGDLPPRPECAPLWHKRLLGGLPRVKLTLLIGKYAQEYYLGTAAAPSVTETVRNFRKSLPEYLPLVHPSPRNKIWHLKNPWFEARVLPELRKRVQDILS